MAITLLLLASTALAGDPSLAGFWNTDQATYSSGVDAETFEAAFRDRRDALASCVVEGELTPLTLDVSFAANGVATTVATSPNDSAKACALAAMAEFTAPEIPADSVVHLPGFLGEPTGDPVILGSLDKELIDAVVKRHLKAIRFCYQRQLTEEPSLAGKIVIKFVIAKDGTVESAKVKSATLPEGSARDCIVGRFKRMKFPSPEGGGIVIVSYPFVFSPG